MMPCPQHIADGDRHISPSTDVWRPDGTCSWCGSMNPDAFLEHVRNGAKLTATYKAYKIYIDIPNPDVGQPHVVSSYNGEKCPTGSGWEKTEDGWVQVAPQGPVKHGKFYFYHLSREQQKTFVELVNTGVAKFGEYGRLYVWPHFFRPGYFDAP